MEDARNALPAWDPQANASRVVNDPAILEREFLAGKLHLVGDHQYNLVGPDGKVWLTPAASVQEALKNGYHFAAHGDVARAEANTALGGLRAVADGALDAATLGFGDALQVKAGVDPEGIKARAEANPMLRAAGSVGGALIPALATGGASIGGLAEAATARAIGTEAAATSLGRMSALAVGGAAEGAAFGVGDKVSESVLGDTPLAADSLLAAGLHGAFWGGATGALLGHVFNRVPTGKVRPTADEVNAAMSRQLGEEAPKGYGQLFLDLTDKLSAKSLEAQGANDLAEVFRGSGASKRQFLKMVETPQAELDASVRKLRDAVEARLGADRISVESLDFIKDPTSYRQTSRDYFAKLYGNKVGSEASSVARAQEPVRLVEKEGGGFFLQDGRHRLEAASNAGVDEIPATLVNKAGDERAGWVRIKPAPHEGFAELQRRAASKASAEVDLAQARLDLKQGRLGDVSVEQPDLVRGSAEARADLLEARAAKEAGGDEFDAAQVKAAKIRKLEADAEKARAELGDAKYASPELNRRVKEAEAALAEAKLPQQLSEQAHQASEVVRLFGVSPDGKVDSGKLQEFVNSITRPKSDPRLQALRNFAGDDASINGLLDDLSQVQAAKNLVRDQLSREQAGGLDLELAAGLVGHGFGGFGGALLAREGAQVATRPMHHLLGKYKAAAVIERVHGYVRRKLDDFVVGPTQALGRKLELDRKLAPTTMLMLNGNRDERRKAVATRITELTTDPELLTTQLESATQHLNGDVPDVSGVMRQRLAQAHGILRQVVPQPLGTAGAGGGLVPRSAHSMIPDRDIRRFAEVDAVLQDPLRLVDQLAAHKLPDPAAVSAFQVAYPALWNHVVQSLVEALQRSPDSVGWKQAVALSVTLGLESHPSMQAASLNLQQALAKPKVNTRPGPASRALGKAADAQLSGAYATINDRLMERPRSH